MFKFQGLWRIYNAVDGPPQKWWTGLQNNGVIYWKEETCGKNIKYMVLREKIALMGTHVGRSPEADPKMWTLWAHQFIVLLGAVMLPVTLVRCTKHHKVDHKWFGLQWGKRNLISLQKGMESMSFWTFVENLYFHLSFWKYNHFLKISKGMSFFSLIICQPRKSEWKFEDFDPKLSLTGRQDPASSMILAGGSQENEVRDGPRSDGLNGPTRYRKMGLGSYRMVTPSYKLVCKLNPINHSYIYHKS